MRARLLIAAISGVAVATAVAAEPPKPTARKADRPANQAVELVVAAADEIRTPAAATDEAAPAKRVRKARVTTCRCGDQPPGN